MWRVALLSSGACFFCDQWLRAYVCVLQATQQGLSRAGLGLFFLHRSVQYDTHCVHGVHANMAGAKSGECRQQCSTCREFQMCLPRVLSRELVLVLDWYCGPLCGAHITLSGASCFGGRV
jgi:hypothetical protein